MFTPVASSALVLDFDEKFHPELIVVRIIDPHAHDLSLTRACGLDALSVKAPSIRGITTFDFANDDHRLLQKADPPMKESC